MTPRLPTYLLLCAALEACGSARRLEGMDDFESAKTYSEWGQYEEALELAEKAVEDDELSPDDEADANFLAAESALALGKHLKAFRLYRKVLENAPWSPHVADIEYRLYEIGVPYRYEFANGPPKLFWFVRQFESNCLFVRKSSFHRVGGCNEQFDIPGGGCLMPDLYKELCELDDAVIVQVMGEASFHQVHGGVSTSVTRDQQKVQWETYTNQYEQIRGRPFHVSQKKQQYIGHMPHQLAARLMLTG